ncbi:hypothetical protein [Tardiphaga sp.]|uniref:hypothetical protein n=1 Tax=Tardiphaga sp. TaxID=1926292 RepID=UPI001990E687|nr:hypothetical protein [Tardiphaga sp.]MBC7581121.1 hypothetical protein [Tardiphaga sp.]
MLPQDQARRIAVWTLSGRNGTERRVVARSRSHCASTALAIVELTLRLFGVT